MTRFAEVVVAGMHACRSACTHVCRFAGVQVKVLHLHPKSYFRKGCRFKNLYFLYLKPSEIDTYGSCSKLAGAQASTLQRLHTCTNLFELSMIAQRVAKLQFP